MAEPRTGTIRALRQGPTWFLARADPGLGRLTESLALMELLAAGGSPVRLLTSSSALPLARRLSPAPAEAFTLERGADPQQTLLDSLSLQRLLTRIQRERPAALVVHGYPLLLPILRQAVDARLVAVANRHDLSSPGHTSGARLVARAFHTASDLILVAELRRGWSLGRLGETPVVRLPALVRPSVLRSNATHEGPVAVLGGGSRGDRRLTDSTGVILDELERATAAGWIPSCRVYPGGEVDPRRHPHLEPAPDPARYPESLRGAPLVVARAGRSSLAELLALGKRAVVVPARSDTLRQAEQAENAARAAALSPGIVVLDFERVSELGPACREANGRSPRRWRPGNDVLMVALEAAESRWLG